MARRGANNPRYRKDAKIGSTRRSASSAKPKREAGDRGAPRAASKSATPQKRRWFEPLPTPTTPQFKFWRRAWAVMLAIGAVFATYAWLNRNNPQTVWPLAAAYFFLFASLYIDIAKVRRMRKDLLIELQSGGKKSGDSSAGSGTEKKGR